MKKLTFYIEKFNIIEDESCVDLGEFSSIKRRLSKLDRAVVSALDKSYTSKASEIIFSSEFGELERLDDLINQFSELNEVSPMKFSGSVHNYSVSSFNLVKKLNIPYQAISSGKCSLSAGLVKALISKNDKVLFCYCDIVNDKPQCVSALISKEKEESLICCTFEKETAENKDEFSSFCDFLNNRSDCFKSELGFIKRV